MSHALSSETGIPVSRLLRLIEEEGRLFLTVRWKGLKQADDTEEPLLRVYEDVPQLVVMHLENKSTLTEMRAKARAKLAL